MGIQITAVNQKILFFRETTTDFYSFCALLWTFENDGKIFICACPPPPCYWIVQVLYSVEQSCNNKTFQLCTKGEAFHLKLFFKGGKKWSDSFRKFKQFPLPRSVFHEFSLISDLVHMCRANNECFQFQSSVSSLPVETNLHFLIGNYFSNHLRKTFFRIVGHWALSYMLWLHLKQNECTAKCKVYSTGKSILE